MTELFGELPAAIVLELDADLSSEEEDMALRYEVEDWVIDANGRPVSGGTAEIVDLLGDPLTVYATEGGTTEEVNPTVPSAGRIDGASGLGVWVEAPDFDINVEFNETSYTQHVRRSPQDVFNVKSYGAKGDNSTNDIASIQAAVDAAEDNGGGDVVFPVGTYRIGSAISVPNFVNLVGMGQSSILRCTGNHYAVNFNPGNRVSVRSLQIDAVSAQSSGGGFDFTNARFNIRIDDIYFSNNTHTGFNIKPNASSGHFYISRVKWNGGANYTNGFLIGDGTNLVAHVNVRAVLGSPNSDADMVNWMIVKNNTDSIDMQDVKFYNGTNGIVIGEDASETVTDSKWNQVLVDHLSGTGLSVVKCRGLDWVDCQVQTCATGIILGAGALGFKATAGTVQNCVGDGVNVVAGAAHWDFDGVTVSDNNTADGASGHGFDIAAAVSNWAIRNCRIGNDILLTTGHQRYGISIAAGASNNFRIVGNEFTGNDTGTISNGATGAISIIEKNLGGTTPTVASAATVTLPGDPVVHISGTTNITSITASYPGRVVTLIFDGVLTLTDGSNLKLAGNYVTTADDAVQLCFDGTNWFDTGRGVN